MKQVINDLYWQAMRELEKIHKSKLSLGDRVAYERAVVKLEVMKALLDKSSVTFASN